ncbi:glycosyltransferase family 2 protein [Nitrospinota bacterium]
MSICIPVYNMENTIERAIRSALNQTYTDIEVVVADNQSTDKTYEIALSINDQRLRVVRNEKNLGPYGNHNRLLELAKGVWVKYLFGDDEMLPICIERMVSAIKECPKDVALIGCGALCHNQFEQEVDKGFVPDELYVFRKSHPREFVLYGNIFGTPTNTLIHRDGLLAIGGFDLSLEPGADGDCWTNLMRSYPSAIMPEHLVIERNDPHSKIGGRVAFSVWGCKHSFLEIEKWHRLDDESKDLPIDKTVYGDWICKAMFRFWHAGFRYLGIGRPHLLWTLWRELGRRNMRIRSLQYYIFNRCRGYTVSRLQKDTWVEGLDNLKVF